MKVKGVKGNRQCLRLQIQTVSGAEVENNKNFSVILQNNWFFTNPMACMMKQIKQFGLTGGRLGFYGQT